MKSLKIALLGYGKMGKEIEKIAIEKSHTIIARIDNSDDWIEQEKQLEEADVAIEFSTPKTVLDNISRCVKMNLPIIIGTTGWYHEMEKVEEECKRNNASILWASNFSIGMNIFFKINSILAQLTDKFPEYKAHIHEIHHTQKLDAPSGTAIAIANGIIESTKNLDSWELTDDVKHSSKNVLPITYDRVDQVPGTHIITYHSEIDELSIKHEAKSRKGFASGAVIAAEWLMGRKGFYNMGDVLK